MYVGSAPIHVGRDLPRESVEKPASQVEGDPADTRTRRCRRGPWSGVNARVRWSKGVRTCTTASCARGSIRRRQVRPTNRGSRRGSRAMRNVPPVRNVIGVLRSLTTSASSSSASWTTAAPPLPRTNTEHVAVECQRPLARRRLEREGLDAEFTRARKHQRRPLADQGRQLVVEERPRVSTGRISASVRVRKSSETMAIPPVPAQSRTPRQGPKPAGPALRIAFRRGDGARAQLRSARPRSSAMRLPGMRPPGMSVGPVGLKA